MTNPYYQHTGVPAFASPGSSSDIRGEFDSIQSGFDAVQQALTALGTGVFVESPNVPTPDQYDNSEAIANTEFVNRTGLRFSSVYTLSTNVDLTDTHSGSQINLTGSSTHVTSLPKQVLLMKGSAILITNNSTATIP